MVTRRCCIVASTSCATSFVRGSVAWAPGFRLGLHHERHAVEELLHPGCQRGRQLVEGAADVALKGRAGQALDERAREIERAQLREGEAGVVEPPEGLLLERPVLLAVVRLVEEREAGRLQRLEIAPDRARRDAGARREVVDGDAA